jgi:hypothetical protein
LALSSVSDFPTAIVEKLEKQLAHIILYIGAIDSLAAMYRGHADLREDAFLFSTVYGSLWDAVIVRIGTIWDNKKGVASLPNLSKQLRRLNSSEAKIVAREIDGAPTTEWIRLKEWRHTIVAHSKFPLDAPSFDRDFEVNVSDVRKEAERIEHLLIKTNNCLDRQPVYYQVLKEDAASNALNSLAKWVGT